MRIILRGFLNAILRIASRNPPSARLELVRQTLVERPRLECPTITESQMRIRQAEHGQAFRDIIALFRTIYEEFEYKKPEIGQKPNFGDLAQQMTEVIAGQGSESRCSESSE